MDIKKAFNHVSKTQLAKKMIKLGIDGKFVALTSSFFTNRKI